MASLPSVALINTVKLDHELRKLSPASTSLVSDKSPNLSHQRNQSHAYTTTNIPNGNSESKSFDFREVEKVESSFYVPLMEECAEAKSVSGARVIHGHIIKSGTHRDAFIMTSLINVYAKCGKMEDAHRTFSNLHRRNVVSWTCLMTGYFHNARPQSAILVFLEMLEAGAYPTIYTLGIVLSACSSLSYVRLATQIHAYCIKYTVESDTITGNCLCSLYSNCNMLQSAVKAFRRTEEKNVISWTTIISACGDNTEPEMGLKLFAEMLNDDIEPNDFTLTRVLSLCCMPQASRLGMQVHSLSIKLGYGESLTVKSAAMYFYLKCGLINDAQKLFHDMETFNLVTWNAMIAGHAQLMDFAADDLSAYQNGIQALELFLKMNRAGMKPDPFTFSSVMKVCSSMVAQEQGEQVHAQGIKKGLLSDVVVGTALVNMYSKCGSIERSCKAFVEMPCRTLISWTAMITGLAQHGRSEQALQLFKDMRLAGVRPNKVTFVGVLSACSHAGKVDEALYYFETMKSEYKITPVMDHYSCIIDMFVRLGQLEEAFSFVEKMDFAPNEFIWSSLVAACRSHGNLELGFQAAERLLRLKPKDAETYVLLLNMYLSAGRYQDVSRVRKMMKDENHGKLNDWSWITIKERIHSFKTNGGSFSQKGIVYELLADLVVKAEKFGYESEESSEESEGNTAPKVVHHSEKLAVAYGLLNTPNSAPIRVVKSISMCRDCHSFIKMVSLLKGREIIIRDNKWLHKFVNGHCSCGDFGAFV